MTARITLESGDFGTYLIRSDDGRLVLVQTDWDYPGVASTFGWSPVLAQRDEDFHCEHDGTDGTVTCPGCGLTAGDFIGSAGEYLDDHEGEEAEDPGYFD